MWNFFSSMYTPADERKKATRSQHNHDKGPLGSIWKSMITSRLTGGQGNEKHNLKKHKHWYAMTKNWPLKPIQELKISKMFEYVSDILVYQIQFDSAYKITYLLFLKTLKGAQNTNT